MRRAVVIAVLIVAAALGRPARAEVLIGVAGPMTGKEAWFGEQIERGAALAVADINAAGGVLDQQVQLITADDFCDPEQAVAAAKKPVSDGVVFIAGHFCSHSSIPASAIYEAAGVLMISPASSNPILTELGRANVFRVTCGGARQRTAARNRLPTLRSRRASRTPLSAGCSRSPAWRPTLQKRSWTDGSQGG